MSSVPRARSRAAGAVLISSLSNDIWRSGLRVQGIESGLFRFGVSMKNMPKFPFVGIALAASVMAVSGVVAFSASSASTSDTPGMQRLVPVADAAPGKATNLREAYKGKFLIGTAADPGNYSDAEMANIKANYD